MATGDGTSVHASFPYILQKFQTQFTLDQVTRPRQKTSHNKKLNARHSTPTERVCIKCISRNVYIGGLRSEYKNKTLTFVPRVSGENIKN